MIISRFDNSLTKLERNAINLSLLEFSGDDARKLASTVPFLKVIAREYTGVGFFVKFARDERLRFPGLDESALKRVPPSISATHPEVDGCVDFLVWIEGGQIDCLEAASTGAWPDDESKFQFLQTS